MQETTPDAVEIVDLPLGIIPGTGYRQTAVQLDPGDLLVLYTDGISEAMNRQRERLGLARLLEIATGLPGDSPAAAGKALLAAVARFRGDAAPTDDETVIALRHRATKSS